MVLHIIRADILLIARIFPRPFGARKNTTQLAKYPRVLYVKPSNKIYLFILHWYITNSQYDQLPVGLVAQLVEHCIGIAEVMGSNPAQT